MRSTAYAGVANPIPLLYEVMQDFEMGVLLLAITSAKTGSNSGRAACFVNKLTLHVVVVR